MPKELSDEEYAKMKNAEREEEDAKRRAYAEKRAKEDQLIFRLRFDAAKIAAGEMADNMTMEPEAIADRAFSIADCLLALSGLLGEESRQRHEQMFLSDGAEVNTTSGSPRTVIRR